MLEDVGTIEEASWNLKSPMMKISSCTTGRAERRNLMSFEAGAIFVIALVLSGGLIPWSHNLHTESAKVAPVKSNWPIRFADRVESSKPSLLFHCISPYTGEALDLFLVGLSSRRTTTHNLSIRHSLKCPQPDLAHIDNHDSGKGICRQSSTLTMPHPAIDPVVVVNR